jgi:hypothetical protein
LGLGVQAKGQYVPTAVDVPGTRTPLVNEGYLIHKVNPAQGINRFGDEYTGWIDIRHPARASVNANNTVFGYDTSDHITRIRTTTLTDANGVTATPNIARDFNFMNRIYGSQAGWSVLETAHRNYTSGGAVPGGNPVNFTFPIDTGGASQSIVDSQFGLAANNLTGGPATKTIDLYYHGELDNDVTSAYRGYAYDSSATVRPDGGPGVFRPFIGIATRGGDAAVADTVAHEVGHFVLNGPSVDNPAPGDPGHSATKTNLMASGSIRWYPGQPANGIAAGDPPSAIPESLAVVGPTMSLNIDGTPKVGGIDQWTGGTTAQSQLRRTFDATGNASTANYLFLAQNRSAGDAIDFDFVADAGRSVPTGGVTSTAPGTIDGVAGADNFPGATPESLYFGIGGSNAGYTVPLPSDVNKDKTGLGVAPAIPNYSGSFFTFADVVSLTTLYSDSDTDPTKSVRSIREGSLDYYVTFVDALGTSALGTPIAVFIDGWSVSTTVENYLARWVAPSGFQAVGLFITALDGVFNGAAYDGNAQIDAVIVGVPEPTAATLILAGLLPMLRRRRH